MPYKVINVPDDSGSQLEQLGTKEKFWYLDSKTGVKTLFKQGRKNTGENWSEVVSSKLAKLLGIPAAEYDFGIWRSFNGVVSPTFIPKSGALIVGNQILGAISKNYDMSMTYRTSQHTVQRVANALISFRMIRPPLHAGLPPIVTNGIDTFLVYLMLDALIGNTDRHHENWGVIAHQVDSEPNKLEVNMAPTFDHAASLGRNESQERIKRRLGSADREFNVEGYALRANSALYGHESNTRPLSTFEAFFELAQHEYFKDSNRLIQLYIDKLSIITRESISDIFVEIPSHLIEDCSMEFATELILFNKNYLSKKITEYGLI